MKENKIYLKLVKNLYIFKLFNLYIYIYIISEENLKIDIKK